MNKIYIVPLIIIFNWFFLVETYAYTDSYPYPTAPTCPGNCTVDEWGMYKRECTSFAAYRADALIGNFHNTMQGPSQISGVFGNAGNWNDNATDIGYTVSSIPQMNAISVQEPNEDGAGPVGHVGVVAKVYENGNIDIVEYNWYPNKKTFNERINISYTSGYSFIIFDDNSCSPPLAGDWQVNSECLIDSVNLTVSGDILIGSNGWLDLINGAILNIDFTVNNLYIEQGGKVTIQHGSKIN